MKWKDSDNPQQSESGSQEDQYEDEGYTSWENRKTQKRLSGSVSGKKLIYIIAGILVLIVISMILIPGINDESDEKAKIQALEAKIQKLQKRLDKYEAIDEKVTRIWEQAKTFEKFKERFDRSEASMSLRMDHLAMSLDALQKKTDEALKKAVEKTVKPVAKKKAVVKKKISTVPAKPKTRKQYHVVKAGDTLYSISRAYGINVKVLMKMNKIASGSVIHTGQKLLVRQ